MFLYYLIKVLPITAIMSILVYLPFYFIYKKKYGKRPLIRHLAIYTLIEVIISILYITIFIDGFYITLNQEYHLLNLVPFIWVKETYSMGFNNMIEQLFMNIIMTVPLGFVFPIIFKSMRKWWKTGISVMMLITCIEIIQYFIGRSADVDDLIMNTLGGLIGYGVVSVAGKCLKNKTWWQNAFGQSS